MTLEHILKQSGARAFIFDMDGTLVDNMKVHHQAWLKWADEEGVTRGEDEEFLALTHGTVREIMQRIFPDASEAQCIAMGERKEACYRKLYRPNLRLLDGVEEFLREAAARQIPMALATAGEWSNIEFTLDGCGVRDLFPVILGGGDVQHGKPHPEVFLKAAEQLGIAPQECLVFEDSVVGAEAARRANMKCIIVNEMSPRNEFGDVAHVLCFARDYYDLDWQTAAAPPT